MTIFQPPWWLLCTTQLDEAGLLDPSPSNIHKIFQLCYPICLVLHSECSFVKIIDLEFSILCVHPDYFLLSFHLFHIESFIQLIYLSFLCCPVQLLKLATGFGWIMNKITECGNWLHNLLCFLLVPPSLPNLYCNLWMLICIHIGFDRIQTFSSGWVASDLVFFVRSVGMFQNIPFIHKHHFYG